MAHKTIDGKENREQKGILKLRRQGNIIKLWKRRQNKFIKSKSIKVY